MNILGIWDGHDSGAAVIVEGKLLAAVNEERLSRRKLEVRFPFRSIQMCLDLASLGPGDIELVAASTTDVAKTLGRCWPGSKERYYAIRRRQSFPTLWTELAKRAKYRIAEFGGGRLSRRLSASAVRRALASCGLRHAKLRMFDHHLSHATTAAVASGFDPCVVVTVDGVGDGLSTTVSIFDRGRLERLCASKARDSIGIFFEHVTNLLNMRELEDEGKVMALADYTYPSDDNPLQVLLRVENLRVLASSPGHAMRSRLKKFHWRYPSEQFARLAQTVVEQRVAELCQEAVTCTGVPRVALSGGVAANIKANQAIRALPGVADVYVFPHMGDGGLAVGAAWAAAMEGGDTPMWNSDDLGLGPAFSPATVATVLREAGLTWCEPPELPSAVAELLAAGKIVIWFQGRMEYGPRALGHRSVLARPDKPELRDRLNLLFKRRAWFQPFCPSVLESDARLLLADFTGSPNRHMTMAYRVNDEGRRRLAGTISVDGSCRPQMVPDADSGIYAALLRACKKAFGTGAVLNTSFNLHGEPIVCTPDEAITVFKRTRVDALAIGPFVLERDA